MDRLKRWLAFVLTLPLWKQVFLLVLFLVLVRLTIWSFEN